MNRHKNNYLEVEIRTDEFLPFISLFFFFEVIMAKRKGSRVIRQITHELTGKHSEPILD